MSSILEPWPVFAVSLTRTFKSIQMDSTLSSSRSISTNSTSVDTYMVDWSLPPRAMAPPS